MLPDINFFMITRATSQPHTPTDTDWYLLQSKPKQEQVAALNLENQGYKCYLPMMQTERIRRGKEFAISLPMFSRYLFIALQIGDQAKSWFPIRSTLGVTGLVYFGDQPAKVEKELIEQMRQHADTKPPEPLFNEGERVVVSDGPYQGIKAVFQAADGNQRAIILLELLSKQVTMKIDLSRIKKDR